MKSLIVATIICLLSTGDDLYAQPDMISNLKFIDEYVIPFYEDFEGTTIGGLSGIDYVSSEDVYYLISDDRSSISPARFYKARIKISSAGIDTVDFIDVEYLARHDGSRFPDAGTTPAEAIDPEAIRYHPPTNKIYWVSEGERTKRNGAMILVDPAIYISNTDGSYHSAIKLPLRFVMQADDVGPRQNGALEGITFDRDFKKLYVALEEPLYEDGPRASLSRDTRPWTRINAFDVATKSNTSQFVYELDPVAHPPKSANGFMVNGVSEILWLADMQILVMERSFSIGRLPCTVKVFLTDFKEASDVKDVPSLLGKSPVVANKKLLLNMDSLGIYIDNIEGMTFGPRLPNGHRTLIFIADDNFNPIERMQILLFEVIP
jgi:hypothetical protein